MRQTHCTNPGCPQPTTRTNDKFKSGKCPHCGVGDKAINIKGGSVLLLKKPDPEFIDERGHSTIPRRIRRTKKDGSPKNKYDP